jgi:hypothetical protein
VPDADIYDGIEGGSGAYPLVVKTTLVLGRLVALMIGLLIYILNS